MKISIVFLMSSFLLLVNVGRSQAEALVGRDVVDLVERMLAAAQRAHGY